MPLIEMLKNLVVDTEVLEKIRFLRKLRIFYGLHHRELAKIYQIMQERNYQPNDVIFKEGDIAHAIFILKKGEVELLKGGKSLAKLKEGEFFGEMALLEEMPRTATARVTSTSEIGFIYKVRFDSLIESDKSLGFKVMYNLAKMMSCRLRETSEELCQESLK